MITVTETTQRTLDTSADIVTYLTETFGKMSTKSRFATGQVVNVTSRAGIGNDICVGDVALMLLDIPSQPWAHVLCLAQSGVPIVMQVPSENLAAREASGE